VPARRFSAITGFAGRVERMARPWAPIGAQIETSTRQRATDAYRRFTSRRLYRRRARVEPGREPFLLLNPDIVPVDTPSMGAIAVVADEPAGTSPRRSGRLMVASVSVLSAVAFVWIRAATPLPYPQFQGLCERMLSAGLSLTPGDTFCDPVPWTSHAAIVGAMLLVAAGFVLACGILAATGRRGTALLPFLAAPAVSFSGILLSDHWWDAHVWPHGTVATGVTTLALMSAPVIAVVPRGLVA
jgi:hypothetical protein